MSDATFATVLNCIDGRAQLPVNEYIRQQTGVAFVDTITGPGVVKLMSDPLDEASREPLRNSTAISVTRHGSKFVYLVAHYDCAGNPVSEDAQKTQLSNGVKEVMSWQFPVQVKALWVNSDWKVEEIS